MKQYEYILDYNKKKCIKFFLTDRWHAVGRLPANRLVSNQSLTRWAKRQAGGRYPTSAQRFLQLQFFMTHYSSFQRVCSAYTGLASFYNMGLVLLNHEFTKQGSVYHTWALLWFYFWAFAIGSTDPFYKALADFFI